MSLYGLFAVMVFLEMLTFFWVASWIGWGWAILIVLGTAVGGIMVMRRAGVAVFRRMRAKFDQGQMPGRELSDGFTMLVAGVLLITPGFIADIVGLLLLVPAFRDVVYRFSSKRLSTRFTVITSNYSTGRQPTLGEVTQGNVIEGEIIDIDPEDPS